MPTRYTTDSGEVAGSVEASEKADALGVNACSSSGPSRDTGTGRMVVG